jgi:SAM-dependent methyltransferase
MLRGALVSHRGERCGVHQFGTRLFQAIQSSDDIDWLYLECADASELIAAANRADILVINHIHSTMPWLDEALRQIKGPTLISVRHEEHFQAVEMAEIAPFDALLCPDPSLLPGDPRIIGLPRFIPEPLIDLPSSPEVFTVGSFGFATPGKGFETLCRLVNDQFDRAMIRINIPPHDQEALVSQAAADAIAADCRREISKPGIDLQISRQFMSEPELLVFLAQNTINAFAYDKPNAQGISSCTDYALAAGRPLAVSRSPMFRHLHGLNPSIILEERPLAAIAAHGFMPLAKLRERFRKDLAGQRWNEAILRVHRQRSLSREVPDGRGFNKILDDRSRDGYASVIAELTRLAPDLIARKIPRANVQQAFVYDTAKRFVADYPTPRILAVGSFEDTALAGLAADGFRYDEVDPNVNGMDLKAFFDLPTTRLSYYDMVICTSVLEHVEQDDQFIAMVSDLLAPGGVGIFTVDFSERYAQTRIKPSIDHRLYTSTDIAHRLMYWARDCVMIDAPNWLDGQDEFEHIGCWYSFASWVFRKRSASELVFARPSVLPAWPERLEICVERPLGVRSLGLYPVEDRQARRLRWMGANAEFSVQLHPTTRPRFLLLKLWGMARPGGTTFRVRVNGADLLSDVLTPGKRFECLLALPDLQGGSQIDIAFESETFLAGDNIRHLGLPFESLALLTQEPGLEAWPKSLDVAQDSLSFVSDTGFSAPETQDGRPLRWTMGNAQIDVKLNPLTLPRFVSLKLWGIGPAEGTSYRLLANEKEILKGRIDGLPTERIGELPDLAGLDQLRLRLESTTFRPSNSDRRTLGVAVERLSLLADKPEPAPSAEQLELATQDQDIVEASGLFPLEQSEGRPLRWTNGAAEFQIDRNPATPPRHISLKLWGFAPEGGTAFKLLVNNQIVIEDRVIGTAVQKIARLPDLEGDSITIRLESGTFQPSAHDIRRLGVALESMALL